MLIDSTYFFNELTIPQLELSVVGGARPVLNNLNNFIKKYEPEILRLLLGYDLYKLFIAGLQELVVEDRWTDLLYGKEFTNRYGQPDKWEGLVAYSDGINIGTYYPEDRVYKVNGPGAHDPASGQNQLRDPFLKDKTYRVEERGTGTLDAGDEYALVNDPGGFDITAHLFNDEGVYVVQFTSPAQLPTPGTIEVQPIKKSLIANYVYYWMSRNEATKSTGSGEKVADAQNATNYTSADKQAAAWNEMIYMNRKCIQFLISNSEIYPEYLAIPPYRRYWGERDQINRERRNILSTTNSYGV